MKNLPVSAFGINRARARVDGRNCYCKECVNKMVTARRNEAKERPIEPGSRQILTLRHRIVMAIENGARTQTEIALAVGKYGRGLKRALQSGSLRERLLNDEAGTSLSQSELRWQYLLLTDELGDALAALLVEGKIRTRSDHAVRLYLPALKIVPVSQAPQMSLFQLTNQFAPKITGVSAQRGAAEKREAPAGLEPPARSRVA